MPVIRELRGMEILDSRGRPTVLARCELASGATAVASVPSGASRGRFEALELRDGDPKRYRGLGCRKAVANIDNAIKRRVAGETFGTQREFDNALIALDATTNCSSLGANAMLAVSIAFARAHAAESGTALYEHFATLTDKAVERLPRLTINLFSGGAHAGRQVAMQDVLIVPLGAESIDLALSQSAEVYACAAELCAERYGMRLLVADEGGLGPPFESARAMIELAIESIERAGFGAGVDFALALDVAASHFYEDGEYAIDGRRLSSKEMIGMFRQWTSEFPIVSIEDGLAEEDWENWPALLKELSGRAVVIGDDLLCTNPERIARAVSVGACDALLLKVNQIGTLSGALDALAAARKADWAISISVRSGETEDNWAADLAVGWQGDFFKNGSLTRSERLAKYNRLLEIERSTRLGF